MLNRVVLISVVLLLSGCAIRQNVKPVEKFSDKEVCVIENSAVRVGFFDSYKKALHSKGYLVRKLPVSATAADCNITSTYTANWRWDLAMYMAFAEIRVYGAGKPIGEAKYDALSGGANMEKFIDADKKIQEMTNQLFPFGPVQESTDGTLRTTNVPGS